MVLTPEQKQVLIEKISYAKSCRCWNCDKSITADNLQGVFLSEVNIEGARMIICKECGEL